MNKHTKILIAVLAIFIVGMTLGVAVAEPVNAKTFKAGKYKGKFTSKQIKSIKKAKAKGKSKSITVKTGKYLKYKHKKYPVKMTLSTHTVDGEKSGKNKAFLEVWSGLGPIDFKKVSI